MEATKTELAEKIRESAVSVLPILILVSLLCLFLTPMQPQLLLAFLIGALMLSSSWACSPWARSNP